MYRQSAFKKYNRIKKKLPLPLRNQINLIEDEMDLNPYSGERKKGDLKEVFVKKFPLLGEEYLLAYKVNEEEREVIFLAIGGHDSSTAICRENLRPVVCFHPQKFPLK